MRIRLGKSNLREANLVRGRILAHRGLWSDVIDKNSKKAICLALENGFGVEFDIRDHVGAVVVSHDPVAVRASLLLEDLEDTLSSVSQAWLAINVKSDGLVPLVPSLPQPHFFFDMSFPEYRKYAWAGKPVAKRISEFEPVTPDELSEDNKVNFWVDCFESDWFLESSRLESVLSLPGPKFFVSPELHGRPYRKTWGVLRELFVTRDDVGICTDYPREFYEEL